MITDKHRFRYFQSAFIRVCLRVNFFLLISCFLTTGLFAQDYFQILAEQINRGSAEQKRDALLQIRRLESEAASRLAVPALHDGEEIVRATAAFSVIYLPEIEAAQNLLPLLRDKSELVRREAAYALGEVGSTSATGALLQILEKDKKREVRGAAAVALGKIGDVSAVEVLIRILSRRLKSEEEFVRRSAAKSIGQIAQAAQFHESTIIAPTSFLPEKYKIFQYPRYEFLIEKFPVFLNATEVLIQTLQNSREFQDAKREAAFALGAIGSPAALPVLRANFDDPDYYLAEISREAVIKISSANPE